MPVISHCTVVYATGAENILDSRKEKPIMNDIIRSQLEEKEKRKKLVNLIM
jgi:hypothetical protein